eukprot:5729339-Prymnesium_polylepis.2
MASMASGGDGGAAIGSSVARGWKRRAWREGGWQGAATPPGDIKAPSSKKMSKEIHFRLLLISLRGFKSQQGEVLKIVEEYSVTKTVAWAMVGYGTQANQTAGYNDAIAVRDQLPWLPLGKAVAI